MGLFAPGGKAFILAVDLALVEHTFLLTGDGCLPQDNVVGGTLLLELDGPGLAIDGGFDLAVFGGDILAYLAGITALVDVVAGHLRIHKVGVAGPGELIRASFAGFGRVAVAIVAEEREEDHQENGHQKEADAPAPSSIGSAGSANVFHFFRKFHMRLLFF